MSSLESTFKELDTTIVPENSSPDDVMKIVADKLDGDTVSQILKAEVGNVSPEFEEKFKNKYIPMILSTTKKIMYGKAGLEKKFFHVGKKINEISFKFIYVELKVVLFFLKWIVRIVTPLIGKSAGTAIHGVVLAGIASLGLSAIESKQNVHELSDKDLKELHDKYKKLRIMSWNYIWENKDAPIHHGVLAADWNNLFPDEREYSHVINLQEMVGVLFAELTHQGREIQKLKMKVAANAV
jgi:hypothetical protein